MYRRDFLLRTSLIWAAATAAAKRALADKGEKMIWPETPANLSWRISIVPPDEPGEPLVVEGAVYGPDGKTPVPGIVVYAYNTDAGGYYARNGHNYPPRLHGWMQTDASGRYELHTIRPGHYPGMQIPAHIHFNLWGAGYPRQWVEELRFEDDPLVTAAMRETGGRGRPLRHRSTSAAGRRRRVALDVEYAGQQDFKLLGS